MSPQRPAGPAFQACGGEVVSRAGQPADEALLAYLCRQALALLDHDPVAARTCAAMALDLAEAMARSADWRRAASSRL
jgi:hypothetical protein